MLNKLTQQKRILVLFSIFAAIIALPLTIIQVKTQQEIRQRAASIPSNAILSDVSLKLLLSNGIKNIEIGKPFMAELHLLNPKNLDISAVEITIKYEDTLKLSHSLFPIDRFDEKTVIENTNDIKYALFNTTANNIKDSDIIIGRFVFEANSFGKPAIFI